MPKELYLYFLIIGGILSQVIVVTSSEGNIEESSNFLLRKKRVLNRDEDLSVGITDFPYVVQIKKFNRLHCVGSILSHRTIITAAGCLLLDINAYTVMSSVKRTTGGEIRNVTEKKMHYGSTQPRTRVRDGVGLVTVHPPFIYNQKTHSIALHSGLLLPNTLGTVAGWGCLSGSFGGTEHRERLRAITVPIMNQRECANIYRNYANITDKEICTFHPNKYCGATDIGAGLVVDNALAGIHLWGGQIVNYNKPDVFLLVQHLEYINWITANIV